MNISYKRGGPPQGPLAKIVTLVIGVLTLIAAFMFSLVFLVILVVGAAVVWLYFWWQTRALRRQLREQMQAQQDAMSAMKATQEEGFAARRDPGHIDIIEGEAVRVIDDKDPGDPPTR